MLFQWVYIFRINLVAKHRSLNFTQETKSKSYNLNTNNRKIQLEPLYLMSSGSVVISQSEKSLKQRTAKTAADFNNFTLQDTNAHSMANLQVKGQWLFLSTNLLLEFPMIVSFCMNHTHYTWSMTSSISFFKVEQKLTLSKHLSTEPFWIFTIFFYNCPTLK